MLDSLLPLAIPAAVFLMLTSFVFASLGRLAIFHFERNARVIVSATLSFLITQSFIANMATVLNVAVWAIGAGITGAIIAAVALQRGKTKHESLETIDEEDANA